MEDVKEFLKSIGLGKNEAEVYVNLVKRGASGAHDIAKETKIHKANVYPAIDNLMDKGLVYAITKDGKRIFYSREPKVLLNYLKEREIELDLIVTKLQSQNFIKTKESNFGISKGKFALRETLLKLLELKKTISTYGIPREMEDEIEIIFSNFNKERIKNRIKLRCIHNVEKKDNKEDIFCRINTALTESKHLPSKYNSPVTTFICATKTILVIWHEDINIIEIDNQEVADSYQNYFELLWKSAKVL